jgi:two-component system, OmpR family, response regulator QseB
MYKILIIEDDIPLANSLKKGLEQIYTIDIAFDGMQANLKDWNNYDLILLDWNLPYIDGVELLRNKRYNKWNGFCIILTANSEEKDMVFALDYGADDYISKPFSWKVLHAKISAILRRNINKKDFKLFNITLDQELGVFLEDNKEVSLTNKEYTLLYELISRPTKIFSKDDLINIIYTKNNEESPESNVIEKHITLIRKKFTYDPIKTIYGVGYRLQSNSSTQKNKN